MVKTPLSGDASLAIIEAIPRYGFDDRLPKPYTAAELGQALGWNGRNEPQ